MTLDGINTDYSAISSEGSRLKDLFRSAKQVHVTNPTGTDFMFSMAPGRVIEVDDGIITADEAKSSLMMERADSLPAGLITFAPLENSANGRVQVPKDYGRNGMIRDTKFEFRNGVAENYTAATNANTFLEDIGPFSGAKNVISSFSIGLNPAMKPMDTGEQNWFPQQAAGLVIVGVGNNQLYGGVNQTNYAGWGWAIPNATVTVDGKVIVKDGKLVF